MSRKRVQNGYSAKIQTACGEMVVNVSMKENKPYRVFINMGKTGDCFFSQLEGFSRVISLAIQNGVELSDVIKHLKGNRCPCMHISEGIKVLSCCDAIATCLSDIMTHIAENGKTEEKINEKL